MKEKVDIKVDWCTHKAAEYACKNWHYSKCIPKSKLVKLGVWENEKFIGCVIFGVGATNTLVKKYGLKQTEGCELVRIALTEHISAVTKIVSFSIKKLRQKCPDLKLLVSFADPNQGHLGIIYQAGNWIYNGKSQASMEYIYKGKRWQGRSFRNSHKGMENHPDVEKIMGSEKLRYLMPLDKEMRKKIISLSLPYPKRVKQAISGDQLESGGAAPTHTLHPSGKSHGDYK